MSLPDSAFTQPEDEGKIFKLTRAMQSYWDYEKPPPAKTTWRGESKRVRASHKAGEKFQLKEVVHTVRNYPLSRTRKVDYEVLLVAFETEPWEYEPEPYHYIWSIYKDRVDIAPDNTPPPPVEEPIPATPLSPQEIEEIIKKHKYPELRNGQEPGINIVTLQIWLKMLGFYTGPTSGQLDENTKKAVKAFRADQRAKNISVPEPPDSLLIVDGKTWEAMENLLKQRLPPDPNTLERPPFPRRRGYDTEEKYQKALYEGLKRFGFPIQPAAQRIKFRLTTGADGVGRLNNLPPGEYDLKIENLNAAPIGNAEIRLVDEDGIPMGGTAILSGPDGEFSVKTQADGLGIVDGIPVGEYEVVVKDVGRDVYETSAGSVEIRLVDQEENPVQAVALISSAMGDADSLKKAIILFKALVRQIEMYEDKNGRNLYPNLIGDRIDDNEFNDKSWHSFSKTWGWFFGAPWIGIMGDLDDGLDLDEDNWGTFETISMLQVWGDYYLNSSQDEAQLLERLENPILICQLSNALGGIKADRLEFSQIGVQVYLSRNAERATIVTALDLLDEITVQGRVLSEDKNLLNALGGNYG